MKYIVAVFLCLFVVSCAHRTASTDLSVTKKVIPQKSQIIVLDAGHGGKDTGTMSKRNHYEEKQITLETAMLVRSYLKALGYKIVMTRTDDIHVPLSMRADMANTLKADLFVSIHYNHSSNKEAKGIEVYHYKEASATKRGAESKKLSSLVLKKMITQAGASSRGVKQANFAVIRETKMPAILIEAGFLSNAEEREKLCDLRYLHNLSCGIAKGIDQYFETAQK